MPGMIERVRGYKPAEVAERKSRVGVAALERMIAEEPAPRRGFAAALVGARALGRWALVAEIKKASPSQGLIRADFDPAALASAYERGGATCLSVLTDEPSFSGSPHHLRAARAAATLPVLYKDFLIDPYQVVEARAHGADCVLVILALVDDDLAGELCAAAREHGLDVVVEVHDEAELERAVELPCEIVGINNRNLTTFELTLTTCEKLAPRVPDDRIVIGESGLRSTGDLERLARSGITTFWVGEVLMRRPDVEHATRDLLSGGPR